jgi:predicted Zn-dependent peptidase
MVLGAYILGGTLTSRIDALLREEKGYTYGLRGAFQPSRRGGVFGVSGSVDTDSTAPAFEDLLGVLRTAVSGGVTAEEVEAARQYLVGVSPLRWETPGAVAGHLATLVGCDLPLSWTDDYLSALRAATVEEVSAAIARHIHPDALTVVAVGAADTVVKACDAVGLPTATVVPA